MSFSKDVTPTPISPPLHLDVNPLPCSDIMPEASSNISSLIRKKMALISMSPSPTPKRRYQQISEVTEMEPVDLDHQSSSFPPRKVLKISARGFIFTWDVVCGCKVNYRINRIESMCYRISDGKTTRDVPLSREHIHFDCPCGQRCEITMNVKLSRAEKKELELQMRKRTKGSEES